jgi:hypothetical protein
MKPFLACVILGIFSTIVFTINTSSFNIMGQEPLKSLNGTMLEVLPPTKSDEKSPPPPSNDSGIPVIFLNQSSEKKTSEGENQTQSSEKKTSEGENQTQSSEKKTSEGENQTDSNKGNIRDNVFKNMTNEGENRTDSATDGQ